MFTIIFRENHVVLWPATKKLKEDLQNANIKFSEEIKKPLKKSPAEKMVRSNSVAEGMLSKTPRKRLESETDEEFYDPNTPDVKMISKKKTQATEVMGTTAHGSLLVSGVQPCTRLAKIMEKQEFWKGSCSISALKNWVPPTLISPYNFENGTMLVGSVEVKTVPSDENYFQIDIKKNILLPSSIWSIMKIIIEKADGDVKAVLSTEKSSVNMNYVAESLESVD